MKIKLFTLLLLCACLASCTAKAPKTYLWDGEQLLKVKKAVASNDPKYKDAYESFIQRADKALEMKKPSVMDKKMTAVSGDKHDYISLARYTWPDPNTPDGLPYITRDGESNPEIYEYDRYKLSGMADAVRDLSIAYYLSKEQKYADKAVSLLRTWFLDPETKMNPNLNFGQTVPGRFDGKGRSYGIIDSYAFIAMLDGIMLLESEKAISAEDLGALREWFAIFSTWMSESDLGKAEKNAANNHSIAYDLQLVMYLLFGGKEEDARALINEFPERRLFVQIEPDGRQPHELRRTIAYWYSVYNLHHMIEMSDIAKKLNIDLYHATSSDGRSIDKAIQFLIPFIGTNGEGFPYQQINGWDGAESLLLQCLYMAAKHNPEGNYMEIYNKYAPQKQDPMFVLLYM